MKGKGKERVVSGEVWGKGAYIVTHSSSLSFSATPTRFGHVGYLFLFAQTRYLGRRNNETCAVEREARVYVWKIEKIKDV